MRKKVLFVLPSLDAGGAETHVIRLANHLDRRRYDVAVATGRASGALTDRLHDDVVLYNLTRSSGTGSFANAIRSMVPLARLLKHMQPDVICSFMEHTSTIATASAAWTGMLDRLVVVIQNTMSRALAPRGDARDIIRLLTRASVRIAYRYPAEVIALCKGVRDDAVRTMPLLAGRVRVIYNAGYDDEVLAAAGQARSVERPNDRVVFVACGRLDAQKGFHHLVRAFADVSQHMLCHLWIIGSGTELDNLKKLAASLGVASRISFLGFQQNPYKYMNAADVFVLSSEYEGFANVVTEAMACARPVVASDCPHGPGEIIQDDVSGVLVAPGDSSELAGAMMRVGSDPELRAALGVAARRRAEDFHAHRIAAEYAELFEGVIARWTGEVNK